MVGGRFRCLSCYFTYCAVLLLGACLNDVEASSCPHIINKQVGDTVELPSCLPTEGVTSATWKRGNTIVADMKEAIAEFKNRVDINPTNFSLTVRNLVREDSGAFSFVSEANDQQRKTVTITLQVHEPITKQPDLTVNSTWHASNQSCTFWLECTANPDSGVTYSWTVRNESRNGTRLQYSIRPQDGDTTFTCTISNSVSRTSESVTRKCSNNTDQNTGQKHFPVLILGVAAGGCLMIVIVVSIVICVCHHKHGQTGSDLNDLTVYADISDVATEDRTPSAMKPCSVYETIDNRVNTVTPGPQTVYDKIQLSRVRKTSVSPYQ